MPPLIPVFIDAERILHETFVARIEHHATLGSTNERAAQAAADGARELPLLIVADQQTAGRGRGSNRWWTGPGGLAMSLLVNREQLSAPTRSRAPMVALAAAVAVAESVAPLLAGHQVGLAWPNDVLVGRRKLAGILIEALADGRHIVGIGINTNNSAADAPPELRRQAATLRDLTGRPHDHTGLLIGLLGRLERNFAGLACDGPRIAARADALCLQHGRALRAEQGRRTLTGVCRGIAPDGALRLETAAGQQLLYSGVLRPVAE
jgi:BirA family biotin operon repressor/biotin-[acetyl-CoA-carboxylase] ligase